MQKDQFAHATVLLFDPKHNIRRQTRSVLNIIGFWDIADFDTLESAVQAAVSRRFDLYVLATEGASDGVAKVVKKIRHGKLGSDPFVPILLTSWNGSLRQVEAIIESGADDLLIHPFATTHMLERVKILSHVRKPFVMTDSYIGPDRRRADVREDDKGVVKVPNALQAAVEERPELGPSPDAVEETLLRLERVKIRNIARRIWWIANDLTKNFGKPGFDGYLEKQLTVLLRSTDSFTDALKLHDAQYLPTLNAAVVKIAAGMQGKPINESSIQLLEETSLALRVASDIDEDSSGAAAEISSAVSRLGVAAEPVMDGEDWRGAGRRLKRR